MASPPHVPVTVIEAHMASNEVVITHLLLLECVNRSTGPLDI